MALLPLTAALWSFEPMMADRTSRISFSFRNVVGLVALSLFVWVTPSAADAQIYRYENSDGSVLYTTTPLSGRRANEVIGGSNTTRTEGARSPGSAARRAMRVPGPNRPNPNPNRTPSAFDSEIREAAERFNIPFEFIKAVIRAESAFDPHALSHAGAMGLMQLMPATAESLNCSDPWDPRENILAGTQYLRILSDRYNGNINLVLSAYNAGPGTVSRYDGIPYEATRRYVERVFQYFTEYMEQAAAP
jgi:hypothetical protein